MIENNQTELTKPGKPYRSLGEKAIARKQKDGNEFKAPFKIPDTGIEASICHYPIRLDIYGNGCGHDCTYCYSKSINHFFQRWDKEDPQEANIDKIRETLYKIFETDKKDKMRKHLETRVPIRLGGMTDMFQPVELERKRMLELLELLNEYNYPAIIVTKGSALIDNHQYLKELSKGNYLLQVTITTDNDIYSEISEPGSMVSTERIRLIKQLKEYQVPVQGRISPLFPIVPIGHDIFDQTSPRLNYFTLELVDKIIEAGAFHIITEFLRLSGFCKNFFKNAAGIDLHEFFTEKSSSSMLSYRQYPLEDKIKLFQAIKDKCVARGVGFSVCPDGGDDPDMDTTKNCCGTDGLWGRDKCFNQERLNNISPEQYKIYQDNFINTAYWQ